MDEPLVVGSPEILIAAGARAGFAASRQPDRQAARRLIPAAVWSDACCLFALGARLISSASAAAAAAGRRRQPCTPPTAVDHLRPVACETPAPSRSCETPNDPNPAAAAGRPTDRGAGADQLPTSAVHRPADDAFDVLPGGAGCPVPAEPRSPSQVRPGSAC